MAEEKEEVQKEEEKPKKKGKSKLIIIIVLVLVLAGGGGFFAYTKFFANKGSANTEEVKKEEDLIKEEEPMLFSLEPFVVNLSDRGRFLKVTLKLELVDKRYEKLAEARVPQIRDAIITLISSKSAESISTPEGKFQLKDELLMRANSATGRDIFKNVYFTDFVMQ
ncbi:MAG: flagellar basal body-associated FliL family protein [Nitrospirae bacterium]|nr:flagellar basal body-associated FliL family protein [Nitrospirota bacterium]